MGKTNFFREGMACLMYSGFSALARELIYKDKPLANWMGTVNSFLTLNLAGAGLWLLTLLLPLPRIGTDVIFGGINAIIRRIFLGFVTGAIVHFASPPLRMAFREHRLCYYIMPVIIAVLGIYMIWLTLILRKR